MQGQLVGLVLRSPHPHARIKSIDVSAAAKLPGVKAIVTRDDFKDQPSEFIPAGEMMINYRDVVRNVMAREKALYEGHPIAAVAATSASIAKQALQADQGRLRGSAARHRRGRGHAAGRAAAARGHDHRRRGAGADGPVQCGQARRVPAGRRRCRVRPGGCRSSSARLRRSPCTRATSSRTPAWRASRKTARRMCGCRRKATGSCVRIARGCSAGTSARFASRQRRSAAASAARRSFIWSPSRSRSPRRRAGR